MGNALTQGSVSSFCNFKIFPAKTLSKSSLNRLPETNKSPLSKNNISTYHTSATKRMDNSSPKDHPDSPDFKRLHPSPNSQGEKDLSLTENDFHILQVFPIKVIINVAKVIRTETLGKVYLVKKDDDGKLYITKAFDKRRMQCLQYSNSVQRNNWLKYQVYLYS